MVNNGPWLPAPFSSPYPSLVVRDAGGGGGGGVVGSGAVTSAATLALATEADVGKPWSLSFTLAWEGGAFGLGGQCNCALLLGDEEAAHVTLTAGLFNFMSVDHLRLSINDDLGGNHALTVPFTYAARHRLTLRWDGTRYRVLLDDAEMMAYALRHPATIPLKDVTLEIVAIGHTSYWTLYDFECRLG